MIIVLQLQGKRIVFQECLWMQLYFFIYTTNIIFILWFYCQDFFSILLLAIISFNKVYFDIFVCFRCFEFSILSSFILLMYCDICINLQLWLDKNEEKYIWSMTVGKAVTFEYLPYKNNILMRSLHANKMNSLLTMIAKWINFSRKFFKNLWVNTGIPFMELQ